MKRFSAVPFAVIVAVVVFLLTQGDGQMRDTEPVGGPALPAGAREARVVRVVDGDTVELGGGLGKARLIGVDTPEVYGRVECYGREASAYAKRQLEGERVRYTVGREARDRYGRLLVYLWLEDGRSFNALLVSRGYARPLTIQPNGDYADRFVSLSRRARVRAVGLWARDACGGAAGR
jgi:micrococcal nuclease